MELETVTSQGTVIPVQKVDTGLNADSAEWCSFPGQEHILLCGTYQLQENVGDVCENKEETPQEPQVRVGGVIIYQIENVSGPSPQLQQCGKMDMCGVLDIKWPDIKFDSKAIFGIVDAEGHFQLLHLQDGNSSIKSAAKIHLSESSLGLSLGWAECEGSGKTLVAASDSAGSLTVLGVSDDVSVVSTWQAHEYEAWITAFQKFDSNLVYSGGDDCRLKGWDLRDTTQPIFSSRWHQMGVCSIQSHPFKEHIFASGSYDEQLLIWDRRAMKKPLQSTTLGGGVWRIKWNPFHGTHILTATMYNGTHIVDCRDSNQDHLPIVAHYTDHNLAYGADWCRLMQQDAAVNNEAHSRPDMIQDTAVSDQQRDHSTFLISTCSFYDHSLHLWEWRCKHRD